MKKRRRATRKAKAPPSEPPRFPAYSIMELAKDLPPADAERVLARLVGIVANMVHPLEGWYDMLRLFNQAMAERNTPYAALFAFVFGSQFSKNEFLERFALGQLKRVRGLQRENARRKEETDKLAARIRGWREEVMAEPGGKRPTYDEIAKHFRVTRSVVKNAFREKPPPKNIRTVGSR